MSHLHVIYPNFSGHYIFSGNSWRITQNTCFFVLSSKKYHGPKALSIGFLFQKIKYLLIFLPT